MGLFEPDNNVKRQLEAYSEIIEELQAKKLDYGASDNPEMQTKAKEIGQKILEAEIQVAQIMDAAERNGHDVETYESELDFFGD